jgi:ribosomal protein L7/L12
MDLEAHVIGLLKQGDKLDALRVYRAATGADLKAAWLAVTEVERGLPLPAPELSELPEPAAFFPPPDDEEKVYEWLRAGHIIAAIRTYRQNTQLGLGQAYRAVLARQARMRYPAENEYSLQCEIVELLAGGQKPEAVRHHQAVTGSPVQEARLIVEAIEQNLL